MKRIVLAFVATGLVIVLGCVNIPKKFEAHITIDIVHHLEEQASSVLDYVEGKTDTLDTGQTDPAEGDIGLLRRVRDFVSPMRTAYAAELKDRSPLIEQIAAKLRERHEEVQKLKKAGIAGENNRGYFELRKTDELTAEDRNTAQRTIAAERKDRKALYQEVARINKDQDVSVSMVERIYAFERLKRAKPGEIFELPPKGDLFDAFKELEIAKKLGEECQPGAWVTIK